jgi:putative glycosyltransferase
MKLSVVATLYRSAPYLEDFYRRVRTAAETITDDVEIILVNDGSPDDSLACALTLRASHPEVTVLDLARNFGHHKAMVTGLAHADGDLVFLIDSDLEEPPELLTRFHAELISGGWDIVYGVQTSRRGGWIERFSGAAFFKLTEMLSDTPLPRNLITARLMTQEFVRALVAHQDRQAQLSYLTALTGFHQHAMEVEKLAHSPTTYSFKRKLDMALKQITTTSTQLLYFVLYLGAAVSALAVSLILFYLSRYLTHGVGVSGFTSLIISIWFLGGATLLALGVIGVYISSILVEVQRRPYTHLRAIYRTSQPAVAAPKIAQ